eukprot:TRINITY_DN10657_c0_g1_i7.p1 TRINITY_DN10657_c0_g1~~TRINITY_DN10657_c0_g1_i7.p1  ORF type:complete len:164 (-),score=22.26 TRINITY_DN10657_c0_g1_i7:236-727(-)
MRTATGKRARERSYSDNQDQPRATRQRVRDPDSNISAAPPTAPPSVPVNAAPIAAAHPAAPVESVAAQPPDVPIAPPASAPPATAPSVVPPLLLRLLDRVPSGTLASGLMNWMCHAAALSTPNPYVRVCLLAGNYIFVSLQVAKDLMKRRRERRAASRTTRRG